MVPKLVQFNEFEISMIRLTLSWNCPKYQAVTIKLEAFVWVVYLIINYYHLVGQSTSTKYQHPRQTLI